ncbi:hypothetical protein BT93_E1226 [Corymbia citriodora subsp. variegata]|nr:hypothetical protein BT93_E1226 [Corymbia citriodora subsp. variegata]
MRFLILAAAATATVLLLLQCSAAPPKEKDIWEPIKNPQDPYVQEIAEFAVKKHNEDARTNLVLKKVVKGETSDFLGTVYRLIIDVNDRADMKRYNTTVWDLKPARILVKFEPVKGNV